MQVKYVKFNFNFLNNEMELIDRFITINSTIRVQEKSKCSIKSGVCFIEHASDASIIDLIKDTFFVALN